MSKEHWILPDRPYTSYEDYLARTGGSAAEKARRYPAEAMLAEIQRSGLRGRGGAGFRTGAKWATVRSHACPVKVVVCNAAEGEPGTFKDRWILRQNPYAVVEGMLVAAHVVGARSLYVGIKASFAPERARLDAAVDEMRSRGLLAGLSLEITAGPEEYLFGEEKALLEVLAGNGPLPREPHYPPYERGPFGTPSSPDPAVVNNVETFAHVASIVRSGADTFRDLGTDDTPGTLVFTVSGDVRRPGIYERPAGITLRELFHDVAGGPREGRTLKAALSGVSTAVIPAARFDTPADFGSLQFIGSGLGSAGFVLFDDRAQMPRVAQTVARFLYVESCNQCTACKHGLRMASRALDALFDPEQASADVLQRALYGARSAPQQNRCYLPVQGSVLVPSLVERFAGEFQEQIAHPGRPTEEVHIPKMVDYDPATHTFRYDERQARKLPDWTYEPPAAPPEPARFAPAPAPLDADRAPLVAQISPDVAAALHARFDGAELSLDEQVNAALREWLRR